MRNRHKNQRTKACDIPVSVKHEVWERDGGACVVCGNRVNTAPNSHYIPRSRGGLGVPENIVTMCTDFTDNKCHHQYDFGGSAERERIQAIVKAYLQAHYPDWDESELIFNKWGFFDDR